MGKFGIKRCIKMENEFTSTKQNDKIKLKRVLNIIDHIWVDIKWNFHERKPDDFTGVYHS